MAISLDAAAQVYREAMQETVKKNSMLYLGEGILLAVAGLLAIVYPLFTSTFIGVPLGWLLILAAIVQAVALYGMRRLPHAAFQAMSIVIILVVGVLLLREALSAATITLLAMIFLLLQGAARVIFGWMIRPFPHWYWVMASGAVGLVLAVILISMLPSPPAWVVGLLVGLELIAEGAAVASLAWGVLQPAAVAEAQQ